MTREQLGQLSKTELVEIILQQQATILQQQALSTQLQAAVAQLQAQVKRLTQPPKDASNSSTPPSKTRKPNRPNRKSNAKRGPGRYDWRQTWLAGSIGRPMTKPKGRYRQL